MNASDKLTLVSMIYKGKLLSVFVVLPTTIEMRCGTLDKKTKVPWKLCDIMSTELGVLQRGSTLTIG